MTIAEFAEIYVNYIEPIGKAVILFFVFITVAYFLVVAKDAKKKQDFITGIFSVMWQGVAAICTYTGLSIWWVVRMLMRIITVIFATVRDFFTSKI